MAVIDKLAGYRANHEDDCDLDLPMGDRPVPDVGHNEQQLLYH